MLRLLSILFSAIFLFAIIGAVGMLAVLYRYGHDLPDYRQLAHYEPPITTRVYAGDGSLVAEYAAEKRSYVPFNAVPTRVIDAFLAAEDKNFFTHPGIDPIGMIRAAVTDLRNRGMGNERRPEGASTITQQVAKNFLLTNEVSFTRKIKEAILAFRIERAFTKQHILELYLNEIYLGQGSYGVAAAALNYFDKGLDELSVSEAAFLGGLPKAPNNYNPQRNPQAAKDRRDYVITNMAKDGFITQAEANEALSEPLVTHSRPESELVEGGEYFSEDIRREVAAQYGEDALYKGGLSVRSTMDPQLQAIAERTLRNGLIAYDRRHGWRGATTKIDPGNGWVRRLREVPEVPGIGDWKIAVVLQVNEAQATIGLGDGRQGHIPMSELHWARPPMPEQRVGAPPTKPADVVQPGDVILVAPVAKSEDGKEHYGADTYALEQIPKVEGALVAMDPHTGRVLAMQGGFSYARSQFNRATQALRQPGSSFKTFIYMAALDSGYTPSSLILDAPIEIDQGPGLPKWRPENFERNFLGPTTMRVGLEKSRNLMAVRMAAALGMDKVANYAERFGVVDQLPHMLSMALGAMSTTPLRMTAAYAQIVNGGKKIEPTLIDRIQDRTGKTIYRHDDRPCDGCTAVFYTDQDMPNIPDKRQQLVDPMTAYQMVHMLEGVVERGTGRVVQEVGKPLAGKTGTSNESKDTWFVGFAPDLAVGVFVGLDDDTTLGVDYLKGGEQEQGATVAAPIFRDFMEEALKDKPPTPFRVAPGIRFVRVDANTGRPTTSADKNAILEAFKPGTVPTGSEESVVDAGAVSSIPLGNATDNNTVGGGSVEEGDTDSANATQVSAPLPPFQSRPQNPALKGLNPAAGPVVAPAIPAAPQAGSIY